MPGSWSDGFEAVVSCQWGGGGLMFEFQDSVDMQAGGEMKVQSWQEIDWEVVTKGLARRIITGAKLMSAQIRLDAGTVIPEHAHPNEQISYVMEGALKFCIRGEELIVHAGQVLVIPSDVPHRVVALEPTLAIDNFSPIRQDWLDHTDFYFHRSDK
jgi:quercetin dioxygenase-like cupin family protein